MGGGIGLDGWSLSEGEIALRAEDVVFDLSRSLRSQISSDLRFNFSEDEKILSGTVNVHHGQYSEDINPFSGRCAGVLLREALSEGKILGWTACSYKSE